MRIKDIGEFGLIERLRRAAPAGSSSVVEGIGDDCAILDPGEGRELLLTCDAQIEGVHFRSGRIGAGQLGRRVAAVNLSDVAAMGGEPLWALCSLAVPEATELPWIEELYSGMHEELGRAGASLVGGNTARLEAGVLVDLFLVGAVERGRALRRGGARPGDLVFVAGALGGAAAGLLLLERGRGGVDERLAVEAIRCHLTPRPLLAEGRALAGTGAVTSCIDVSDGLAQDALHLAQESRVELCLEVERLPISEACAAAAAAVGADPAELALSGGEDFALLFTAPPGTEAAVIAAVGRASGTAVRRVGEIRAGGPGVVVERGGRPVAPGSAGYDHFRRP